MKRNFTVFFSLFLWASFVANAQTTIVSMGSAWKYLDNGSNQGTAWYGTTFNDASWASGNAQLGYGDGDEATVVSYGSNSNAKYTTTYFRKSITVADASAYSSYTLNIKRDDGIVVYVNGVEKYRNNMPTGTISYNTFASTACSDDGGTIQTTTFSSGTLVTGTNVISVEIHQSDLTSSDISFDMEILGTVTSAPSTIVSMGSAWKYLDNGSNQGTAWYGTGFNDAGWASGNAQLGYGDGDEATVVSYGSNSNAKYTTTYFRKSITVANASTYTSYTLNVKRDDGIIVYVNGIERYRNNMPTGTVAYNTFASTVCSDDGATIQTTTLSSSTMVSGTNVIAVEVHQSDLTSSDISFDFELIGQTGTGGSNATLSRGPYLQTGTPTSVIVKWRTNVATNSKVSFGTTAGSLTSSVNDAALVTGHEVKITGLTANTKYYYSIGSSTQTLQGDVNNYFTTSPAAGTSKLTRIWVTGDCGNNSTNQKNVRDKYQTYLGTNNTDVWLLAGDNAYNSGTDAEYQSNFFDIYKDKMLKQAVLWPAPGNHDYANNATRQNDHNVPYYSNFSVPTNAEAGGVASNTEAFYSFNYANIHFISLDSYGKESNSYRLYDTLGPQVTWLKQDLAANTQKWTVVYFHHPPYTMGSHNSDTESELVSIRQNFIRILERYKVDLIVCGHSHVYERTKLIKGHYGNESTFSSATHNLSTSSGKYDGSASSCPYVKNVSTSYNGSVYVVAGSSGSLGGTQSAWPHNAMHFSDATNGGSMIIEIDQNRLDAKWLCADGATRDQFTVFKDVNKTTNISLIQGQSTTLTASWVGNYMWSSSSAITKSITVSPTVNTTITCQDNNSCVTDVFNITVMPAKMAGVNLDESIVENGLIVYPNPVESLTTIEYIVPSAGEVNLSLHDTQNNFSKSLVKEVKKEGNYFYSLDTKSLGLTPGIYILKLSVNGKEFEERISIVK